MEKIPLLSFFSGAGFLDIGFLRQNKFNFVWHNECHGPFADAYEHGVGALGYNTSNNKIQCRARVENITVKGIIEKAFGKRPPEFYGIVGGPPCPDFSIAGKNNGKKGKSGKLTGQYVRMITRLSPTFFLLENVPGLLEIKKHREFLFSLLQKLSADYALDMRLLNAVEYGVPQDRRRVFIVGFRKKWLRANYLGGAAAIAKSESIVNMDVSPARTADEIKSELTNHHWFGWPRRKFPDVLDMQTCPPELRVGRAFAQISKRHANAGDKFSAYSKKILGNQIAEGDVSRKSFKRLHRKRYSPNAAYGNNEVHLHPTECRRISVAEALAIQSVPSEYSFPKDMTLTDKFKAVGNGVPVRLAECVAKSILTFIQKGEKHGTL